MVLEGGADGGGAEAATAFGGPSGRLAGLRDGAAPPAQPRLRLSPNAIEALLLGHLWANGDRQSSRNLRGAWVVVPFSRGVQTKFDGEWERAGPAAFTTFCWYLGVFDSGGGFAQPYMGDLCSVLKAEFTSATGAPARERERERERRGALASFAVAQFFFPSRLTRSQTGRPGPRESGG